MTDLPEACRVIAERTDALPLKPSVLPPNEADAALGRGDLAEAARLAGSGVFSARPHAPLIHRLLALRRFELVGPEVLSACRPGEVDCHGRTALHAAAMSPKPELVRELLGRGHAATAREWLHGATPLDLAAFVNRDEAAALLARAARTSPPVAPPPSASPASIRWRRLGTLERDLLREWGDLWNHLLVADGSWRGDDDPLDQNEAYWYPVLALRGRFAEALRDPR